MLGLSVGILGASTFRRLFKEEVGKCARTDVSGLYFFWSSVALWLFVGKNREVIASRPITFFFFCPFVLC